MSVQINTFLFIEGNIMTGQNFFVFSARRSNPYFRLDNFDWSKKCSKIEEKFTFTFNKNEKQISTQLIPRFPDIFKMFKTFLIKEIIFIELLKNIL